jgi:CRISPR system Cascade subunit CasE
MFLSRLALNPRDRQVRFDLGRSYEMHRTLWRGLPEGEPGRVLFRLDTDRYGCNPIALVQSEKEPDWSRLPAGYLTLPHECKRFDPEFVVGQLLRFRLRANPTKRVASKNERLGAVMAGKRIGLQTEAEQLRWLLRKGERGGFRIPGHWIAAQDPITGEPKPIPNFRADAIPEGRDRNGKPGHGGEFVAVRFDGMLAVTDPALFLLTLQQGIGSAKGFGFGLLSVARAEGSA